MEEKKAKGIPVFIGVACVWMGTHFGPGVASGTQITVYYVKYGLAGVFCSIIAMAILGCVLFCAAEYSRIYKTYDYESWITGVYGKKWAVILFDIAFAMVCCTALGGSLNAVATLLNSMLGFNYWLGVAIVIICTILLCIFGANLVRVSSSYMMFIVMGILIFITIVVAAKGDGSLSESIAQQRENLPDAMNWGKGIVRAFVYAGFQATMIGSIAAVSGDLTCRSEVKKATVFGFIGNSAMLIMLSLLLFSFTCRFDIMGESLPLFTVLQRLGMNWFSWIYVITVFIAVLSTAVGFCFSGASRFGRYYRNKAEGADNSKRDAIFIGCLLLATAAASRFGIMALVSVGTTILGYLDIPILIIPAVVLGGYKIRKQYLIDHHIDLTGIDK